NINMDNVVLVISTSLVSGILATILTLVCQKLGETKKGKREIFETLMAHRYLISDKENVEALNKIEIVFYKHDDVRLAWKDFMKAADDATLNPANNKIDDCYLKLLEKISKAVGYKNISWDEIKKCYFPQGLSSKIVEEEALRKAQLRQATVVVDQDHPNPSQMTKEEMGMRVIMKALENPEGMGALGKLIDLGSKNKKGGKAK
ncbi:MAG: hypothetical protein J6U92_03520, partial [Clostridia bacterium]|nr:hypothetical protein [Clostridia bacterium]